MGCSVSSGLINVKPCANKTHSISEENKKQFRPSVVCNQNIARRQEDGKRDKVTATIKTQTSYFSSEGPYTAGNCQNLNSNRCIGVVDKTNAKVLCVDNVSKTLEVQSATNTTTSSPPITSITSPRCRRFSRLDCEWNHTRPSASQGHLGLSLRPFYASSTFETESCVFDNGFLAIELQLNINNIDSGLSESHQEQHNIQKNIITDCLSNDEIVGSEELCIGVCQEPKTNIEPQIIKVEEDEFQKDSLLNDVTRVVALEPQSSSISVLSQELKFNSTKLFTNSNYAELTSAPAQSTYPENNILQIEISRTSFDKMNKTQSSDSQSSSPNSAITTDDETCAKNEQNKDKTTNLKEETDVMLIDFNDKSCQNKESSNDVQCRKTSRGFESLDLVNLKNEKLFNESKTSSDTQSNQESPGVCKPLENMVIQQHLDANIGTIDTEQIQENSPANACNNVHVLESSERDVMVDAGVCVDVTINDKDSNELDNLPNYYNQLMLPDKKTASEDSESDGDSAYSYESDYFPLEAVDPHPVKSVAQAMSSDKVRLAEGNIVHNGRSQDSIRLMEKDIMSAMLKREIQLSHSASKDSKPGKSEGHHHVASWAAADDYKLERNPNRSVRGSTSSVGCQMRRGDSTNSLSSQRSQEIKWPIEHVHMNFYNDFGDCFDEEEDFGQLYCR